MENQTPPSSAKLDFNLDARTIATIKWGAIAYAIAAVVRYLFSSYSFYFGGGFYGSLYSSLLDTFNFGLLLRELIVGVIVGAIIGFVLSKFYQYIQLWNTRYLKGKLDTFFKLLFYPSILGYIIGVISGAAFAVMGLGLGFIILLGGNILASYIYAKLLTVKVGSLYPAPVSTK